MCICILPCNKSTGVRVRAGRADVEKVDLKGRTALHYAAAGGRLACVAFLVHFGANPWQLDNECRTPLATALLHQRHEVRRE